MNIFGIARQWPSWCGTIKKLVFFPICEEMFINILLYFKNSQFLIFPCFLY